MRTPLARRVPPELGWYRRRQYDERANHEAFGEEWGAVVHRDGFRSAYWVQRRTRLAWRCTLWRRGRPIPCATFRGMLQRPRVPKEQRHG